MTGIARRMRLLAGAALALGGCTVDYYEAPPQVSPAPPPAWADATGIDDYAWIDRAEEISETVGEAPPDFSFAFEGAEPWAWRLDDGTLLIVEQQGDGLHNYYFDPGYDAPFLVRDPERSFAFVFGQVAVVHGADGEALPHAAGEAWLATAMAGYQRGRRLYAAWLRRDRAQAVEVASWLDWTWMTADWNRRWHDGSRRPGKWRAHRERREAIGRRHGRDAERSRREEAAERMRQWKEDNWRGTPPAGRYRAPPEGARGERRDGPLGPRPGTRPPPRPAGAPVPPPASPVVTEPAAPAPVAAVPAPARPPRSRPGGRADGEAPPPPLARPNPRTPDVRPGRPIEGPRPRPTPQGYAPPPPLPPQAAPVQPSASSSDL